MVVAIWKNWYVGSCVTIWVSRPTDAVDLVIWASGCKVAANHVVEELDGIDIDIIGGMNVSGWHVCRFGKSVELKRHRRQFADSVGSIIVE